MQGTIRSFDEKHREHLHECVHNVSTLIAQSGGARADVNIIRGYPVTSNDEELTHWAVPVLKRVAGDAHVGMVPKTCGAEDFSYYQKVVPGFFFFIGCTPKDRECKQVDANHSPRFYVDESGLKLGVRALSTLAIDWLAANATG
jgi:amidohydrolase